MSFVPDMRQLNGLSYEIASLYGMPHLFGEYYRDDVDATRWVPRDERTCACCGRTYFHRWSLHHEPPKSKGRSFNLATPMGTFVLKPALIGLCGSGTEGCHGDRHARLLTIRWAWESDENAERWWSGHWLSHGYMSNSQRLFELGHYEFERGGMVKQVRSLSDVQWRDFR